MMQLNKNFMATCAAVLLLAANALGQGKDLVDGVVKDQAKAQVKDAVNFEQLVPEDAWLVLGIDDLAATRERWANTPLGKWWKSDAVQALVKDEMQASAKKNKERMQELGVEEDAWNWPNSLGIGFYIVHDEELDADLPHFIVCGVWNENADKVNTIFEAVFTEMQKKDAGAVSSVDIHGVSGKAIQAREKNAPVKKKRRGSGNSFVPEGALDHIETVYFVRDGNRFFFGSVKQDIDEAMGVYEGKSRKSVADSLDFKKTLDSVGRGDGWMVMLTSGLHKVAGAGGPQVALIQPFLQTLFGDIHGYGFALSSEAPGAQFQLLSSIMIEGDRIGVLGLFNPAKSASPPPAFVPSDATGYGTINVQYNQVMKLIESVVASMPEEVSEPFDASLQQYGPDLARVFSKLGPDTHIIQRKISKDFNLAKGDTSKAMSANEEASGLYAIRCSDEQSMTTLLNLFLPQAGFEPRDFNGNTIFDEKSRESSCGFGGGWFFMGKSAFVEQGLRAVVGNPTGGTLAQTPACRQVLADIGANPVLCWGYQDMLLSVEQGDKSKSKSPSLSAGYDSDDSDVANKLGLGVPMDPLAILLNDDESHWKQALGPSVFTMTQESSALITKIRLLPPTTP